jgi:biopolymer transport protein TolR
MQSQLSRSNRTRRSFQPMSEINVTPFVDVMLVLLIIFMVTAPLMTVGVEVDLPHSNASALRDPVEPLVISIDKKEQVYLQETKVKSGELIPRLGAIAKNNKDIQIYIRGDKHLSYGHIMELMGQVSEAGYSKVALITEIKQKTRRK